MKISDSEKEFFELYRTSDNDNSVKQWVSKRNRDRFFKDFSIVKEAGSRDLGKFWNQKLGTFIGPNAEIPENISHPLYLINDKGQLVIKGESYALKTRDLNSLIAFCSERNYELTICEGYETWNPGQTFSIIIETKLTLAVK